MIARTLLRELAPAVRDDCVESIYGRRMYDEARVRERKRLIDHVEYFVGPPPSFYEKLEHASSPPRGASRTSKEPLASVRIAP